MNRQQAQQALRTIAKEIDFLENTVRTLSWDMRVNLPRDAGEYRGNTIGFLAEQVYERKTSEKMGEILALLENEEDPILAAMVRKFSHDYTYLREVPAQLDAAYAAHKLKTEVVWQQARSANDFAMIIPWAEQEFDYLREIAAAHGYADDPMTGLMSSGDPGLTREKVDTLFGELKDFSLPFLEQLKSSSRQPAVIRFEEPFPEDLQRALITEVLTDIGYDFNRGRIDVSAHPYTTANDRNDVRFTTRFYADSFLPALISSMHESGHGMHAQNSMPELRYTTLENAPYDAICESQSRFIENVIGHSEAFWEYCLPKAVRYFPQLSKYTPQQIYDSSSAYSLAPNRLMSDEFTYNLHIMIRYELEKQLFDREISFADLPELWNRKYEEYLGVRPANDAEGVLNDMHWYSGYIGYFQSYVMANFYDGHYLASMRRDIPDMYDQIRQGQFSAVTGWLREHIQQYGGMYQPAELLQKIDGETLTTKHYITYIKDKYSQLYGL